jgi:hypothetical protein
MQTAPNCAAAPLNTGVGALCKGGFLYAGCAILVVFKHDPGLSPSPSTAGHGHEAPELATYRDQLVTGSFIMCPWQVWFKMDLECYCSSQT